jgi:hypothetical protein
MNAQDVIINPKTNRPIVIGSRVHRMLIANAIYKIQERESSIMYNINEPNKEIEGLDFLESSNYDEKIHYISTHGGKIVKRLKCIKTKDILKHIISVIPEVIDKYLNYVEDTDTPDQMKAKLTQLLHNCILKV